MKTFAILGCGFLGNIVASAYKQNLLEGYELIGAYSRKKEDAVKLLEGTNGTVCETTQELLNLKPDFLVETASIALLKEIALQALSQGTSLVPLSIGAFADEDFREKSMNAATESGAKIHIPSGAVGGFDVLQTIALMAKAGVKPVAPYGSISNGQTPNDENSFVEHPELTAEIHTHKGPASLKNTPLFEEHLMTDKEETTVFQGSTKEAITLLPTKVNVAIASALASAGTQKTTATITSVPGFVGDDHCITVESDGLKATVDIYSSTSAIAGWSVVALLRNLESPMQFY